LAFTASIRRLEDKQGGFMRRITSFLMQGMPLVSAILVLSLTASVAHAGAVSCGAEQSSGSTPYTTMYTIPKESTCMASFATVYAYKDCLDQNGNACRISWDEN